MSLTIPSLPVHTANFSGCWERDVLNHGKIKLSSVDVEEFEAGKIRLTESRTLEIGDIFNSLRTIHIPNMLSLFAGEDLDKATKKAREVIYRTFLQVSDHFNAAFPSHFDLREEKVLVPTFTDFQNKTIGIGIHTEGGQCVRKLQALTYMPTKIKSKLTLYNLFNPDQGKCNNRNLNAIQNKLESATLESSDLENLSVVFMVDGESGTAHSSQVEPQQTNETLERIIWTIIVNKIPKLKLESLIPNFKAWLEEDILRFARCKKREDKEVRNDLSNYTL